LKPTKAQISLFSNIFSFVGELPVFYIGIGLVYCVGIISASFGPIFIASSVLGSKCAFLP